MTISGAVISILGCAILEAKRHKPLGTVIAS